MILDIGVYGNQLGSVFSTIWDSSVQLIPGIIAAIIILTIGYILGWLLFVAVEKALIKLKLDRWVIEETGLKNVEIINQLPDTFHIYQQKKKWFLKKTYWFLMNTKEETKLVPETKEDISEAVWMNKREGHIAITNSYRSLYDTLGYLFC